MLDQNDIEVVLKKINRSDLKLTYDTSYFYTNDGNIKFYGINIIKLLNMSTLLKTFQNFQILIQP